LFRKKVESDPEQCLRYGGTPLWLEKPNLVTIPNCPGCGGGRVFEFQLMPSLIYLLTQSQPNTEIGLNFGVVAFFTCLANCRSEEQLYFEEFYVLQDAI